MNRASVFLFWLRILPHRDPVIRLALSACQKNDCDRYFVFSSNLSRFSYVTFNVSLLNTGCMKGSIYGPSENSISSGQWLLASELVYSRSCSAISTGGTCN